MHKLHPTSLLRSKFYDYVPILGLETSSFVAMWLFGGFGGYSTTTASSVEATSSRLTHSIAFFFPYPLPGHVPSHGTLFESYFSCNTCIDTQICSQGLFCRIWKTFTRRQVRMSRYPPNSCSKQLY
ncbi:hypothetical protein M405DRAFT_286039 [Rhizopogon salebrosus TDB-379]|nr:hypothetical protein M405DRAFT_286039 [Rhizopogon salebrosus TDB-379]